MEQSEQFVTFESELPENLVADLNNSYSEGLSSSSIAQDQQHEQPQLRIPQGLRFSEDASNNLRSTSQKYQGDSRTSMDSIPPTTQFDGRPPQNSEREHKREEFPEIIKRFPQRRSGDTDAKPNVPTQRAPGPTEKTNSANGASRADLCRCIIMIVAAIFFWTGSVYILVNCTPFKDFAVSQKAQTRIRNLALKSEGARVLEGYTTPPIRISPSWLPTSWWLYSDRYRLDPECVLRPSAAECWPLTASSTLGVELGNTAAVSHIAVDWIEPKYELILHDLTIYSISSVGDIKLEGISPRSRSISFPKPIIASQFIVRIRFEELLPASDETAHVFGCLCSVIIEGEYVS